MLTVFLTPSRRILAITIFAAMTSAGTCSEGAKTTPSAQLQVGGDYNVLKTTTSDTCAGTIGAPVTTPSSVAHSAGSSSFTLNDHGTRSLPGQVALNGTMTMPTSTSVVQNTIPATDTFTNGRFTTTGLEVTVTTDLSDTPTRAGAGPCRVVTTWQGTKIGAPNVIPG